MSAGTGALIYVAGPYTHPDPVVNTQRAVALAEELLTLGYVPIVPHLSMVWHLISPHDIDFWYEYDLRVMRRCDAVLRFDGASTGADRECEVARAEGIPVYYSVADLREGKE